MAGIVAHEMADLCAVRLAASGEFDRDNHGDIAVAVLQALAGGRRSVVLDFGGVTFIDAAAVRTLVTCQDLALAGGGSLEIVNATGIVARVLDITAAAAGHHPGDVGGGVTHRASEFGASGPRGGVSPVAVSTSIELTEVSAQLVDRARDLISESRKIIATIHG